MQLVQAGWRQITETSPTKKIEQVARVCYKSEDKIAEGTDIIMIGNLLKRKHYAMLEHADICVEVCKSLYDYIHSACTMMKECLFGSRESERVYLRFSDCLLDPVHNVHRFLVSGNIRAWLETFQNMQDYTEIDNTLLKTVVDAAGGENGALREFWDSIKESDENAYEPDCLRLITDYTTLTKEERMLHETFTILFTCDRGVSHEIVRMREGSFGQESTRYCNYGNNKFGASISVIEPIFFEKDSEAYLEWEAAMRDAERHYLRLTQVLRVPAQQARTVLPHSTKVEIAVTANLREWRHIFNLRACDATGPAHPQMSEVARPCLIGMKEKYDFAFGDLVIPA